MNSKQAYDMWTGPLYNAPQEILEEALQRCLNGVPPPVITPNRYKYDLWYMHTPYDAVYEQLLEFFKTHIRPDDAHNTFISGAPSWLPDHPLFRDMELNNSMFHYHWTEVFINHISKELKLTEIRQGWKYSDEDRETLIAEEMFQQRYAERKNAEDRARLYEPQVQYVPTPEPEQPKTYVEIVQDFDNNHPFWSGFLGAALYFRIKDALFK